MKRFSTPVRAAVLAASFFIVLIILWLVFVLSDLPDVATLKTYRPAAASEVLDRSGLPVAQYFDRAFRIWIPLAAVPDRVIQAVVTAEDDTFFGHQGVNYKAVWDAFRHDLRKGSFARGGSTITQQMIKNVLLSKNKTLARKVREFVLARRAEDILTKGQILELYLNEVEWGENIYGIEAASRAYFDKHAAELTAAEAALLAGMLPNPRYFNPLNRIEKARDRQERVLFNMFQAKLLTEEEYGAAQQEPLVLRSRSSQRFSVPGGNGRPCAEKALEAVLSAFYDERELYRRGLKIATTLDRPLQRQVAAMSEPAGHGQGADFEQVTVVKEGPDIRAVVCAGADDRIAAYLAGVGAPSPAYEVVSLAPAAIAREELLAAGPESR